MGWDDVWIRVSFAAAIALFIGFIVRELRTKAPMLDLTLFHDRGQTATAIGNPVAAGSGSSLVATSQTVDVLSDALFSGISRKSVLIPSGYSSGGQTIYEGNRVVHVRLTTAQGTYDADLIAGASPSGFTVVASTYTPTPAPTVAPTAAPTPIPAFKSWPAKLVLGASGNPVGTSSGALAYLTPKQWIGRALNGILAGGVALAASPCYGLAETTSGAVDTTLDSYPQVESALGVYVDTNGIAEHLVRAALDAARDAGAHHVDLTSNPSREAANRLYVRLGFERRETNAYRFQL